MIWKEYDVSDKTVTNAPPTALWRRPTGDTPLIGICAPSYSMERVSYMIPSALHRYVTLKPLPLHRFERNGTFLAYTPFLLGARVDLVHTFNQIPLNRRFVVTAELEMPRYLGEASAAQIRFGLSRLASDRCRRILALSEATQAYLGRRFTDAGFPELVDKMMVFRGAVHPGPQQARLEPAAGGPLRLMFVGGDGLRKGLEPMVDAVAAARAAGIDVVLTVIGRPTAASYVMPDMRVDPAPLERRLHETPWITWHTSLPNSEVRRLMLEHDIFLLPTLDDSLGWVPAEAALAGMPSIVTNIFALPELVIDGETGWVVDLQLNADRRWRHLGDATAAAQWDAAQETIRAGILSVLMGIAGDRARVRQMGEAARRHIAGLYGFDVAETALHGIYRQAM